MGGGDRACRGYHPGDNSDSNYVVHWRISFEECKARWGLISYTLSPKP